MSKRENFLKIVNGFTPPAHDYKFMVRGHLLSSGHWIDLEIIIGLNQIKSDFNQILIQICSWIFTRRDKIK